ncbi:hypothetical protein IWQ60_011228 [Tieghemiomyces parasiticus]|uniref:rRNA methyltransferase 1, mitochondrial n=1 Tax=Tieghemiomyces parasiticus TaxID=78921 RepID=A0A9W7ZSE7_9FUNG|nr:hypothetical protein IWQ60_011228 [Tieghemiomyces parasiticus]
MSSLFHQTRSTLRVPIWGALRHSWLQNAFLGHWTSPSLLRHYHDKAKPNPVEYTERPRFDRTRAKPDKSKSPPRDNLYGISAVQAALTAKKRHCFRLIKQNSNDLADDPTNRTGSIFRLAEQHGVPVLHMPKWEMNVITQNRPHQGTILEAEPLTVPRIERLSEWKDGKYEAIGPKKQRTTVLAEKPPVWLLLDQIMDPQNLGSILRSAYYFGIDGVVVSTKTSAPFSSVVAKASSGALEFVNLFTASSATQFIKSASDAHWLTYGTACSPSDGKQLIQPHQLENPDRPIILVMGNEDLCQVLVTIPSHNSQMDSIVDSLNVSVATGILLSSLRCQRSMPPKTTVEPNETDGLAA